MRGLATAIRIGLGMAMVMSVCSVTLVAPAVAKDLTTPLPRQPLLPYVVAASGPHILLRAERSFRISHDSGKTWAVANFPCPSYPDYCYGYADQERSGRVSGGIVTTETPALDRFDAYSLIADAPVGTPYTLQTGESVVDRVGGLMLLQTWPSQAYSVRSLLDGSVRAVAVPDGSISSLLPDGSVLYGSGAGEQWYRLRPDGTATLVLSVSPGADNRSFSGNLMAYTSAKKVCVLNAATATTTCRTLSATPFIIRAFNASGVLLDTAKSRYLWYPLSGGKLGTAHSYAALIRPKGAYYEQQSGENGAVVTVKATPSTRLYLFKSNGKVTKRTISWATRPVVPTSLALTSTTVVGGTDADFTSHNWRRTATSTLGAAHVLRGKGRVAAFGDRLAVDDSGGRLWIYDRGAVTGSRWSTSPAAYSFSGAYLLARDVCRDHLRGTDEDCDSSLALFNAKGKPVTLTGAPSGSVLEDVFGELAAVRTGDGSLTSRTVTVFDFANTARPTFSIELPDPGAGGFISDVRLWGDWVAATVRPATDGQEYPVVVNYRTGAGYTGPVKSRLVQLGDGFVVSLLPHSSTLSVWNFTTGTASQLASTAKVAAVNGPRLVYVKSGKLVVTSVAGTGLTAPRVLSVVTTKTGSRTWKLAIDATKPLKAGRVSVTNAAGTVVRTIKVGATKTGSLRGIVWNGKTTSGVKAPAGRYTFRLIATATDGSGSVGDVYGGSDPIAAVTIS